MENGMDFHSIVLGLLFVLTLIQALRSLSKRGKNLPPGPVPLWIIGNLPLLGDKPHKSLTQLAKTHGPIMRLQLGRITTVVISSAAVAKEVLQTKDFEFSSRSVPNAIHTHNHYMYSVVFLPVAARWRSLRKILNISIFSGSRLDANMRLRSKKVQELVDYCRKNSETGETVDVGRAVFRTSLNMLSNTIFSTDLTDPFSDSAREFKDLIWNMMVEAGKPNLADFFPVLGNVDPQGIRRRMTVYFEKVFKVFDGLITERLQRRKKTLNDGNTDVLDVLLNISEESPQEIDRTYIDHMCMDLFAAGTDTTSSTLEWAMAEAMRNPDAMKKAKAEIKQVIGEGKIIDETDISRLPYLHCMVKETLRIHPPVPFLIPRTVTQDVEVCGYTVPKGCQVLVNAWAIGRDPTVWENPLEFNPDRFWESEMDVRGRDFELIPFGAGRRICPGLPLALRMLPVMLGSLLNSFEWKLDGGIAAMDLDMDEKFGLTLQKAHPLQVIPIPL